MTTDVNQALTVATTLATTDNDWQVYFDPNRLIGETFTGDAYPAPAQLHLVEQS